MAAGGGGFAAASVARFRSNLKARQDDMREGARSGLLVAAIHVLGVSNESIPLEDGDLMRDGTASVASDELKAAVSYGRDPEVAKYADRQHEDMSLRHDAGRNAKFLENAMNSEASAVPQIVADHIKQTMGS